jgi:hypothetical protein
MLRRETSVLTRATRRNIPEHGILHGHRRENLKSREFLLQILNKLYIKYWKVTNIYDFEINIISIKNLQVCD